MSGSLNSSLVGGHLALDFCNTVGGRDSTGAPRREKLLRYDDLVYWAELDGLVTPAQARALRIRAAEAPEAAEAALKKARALRETLYPLFTAAARAESVPAAPLSALNEALAEAASQRRLVSRDARLRWGWMPSDALDALLRPIVQEAADLLTSADPRRLKVCAGEGCGFLYLDQSRNRSRRWCDMADCGNRAKVRRHRRRRQDA